PLGSSGCSPLPAAARPRIGRRGLARGSSALLQATSRGGILWRRPRTAGSASGGGKPPGLPRLASACGTSHKPPTPRGSRVLGSPIPPGWGCGLGLAPARTPARIWRGWSCGRRWCGCSRGPPSSLLAEALSAQHPLAPLALPCDALLVVAAGLAEGAEAGVAVVVDALCAVGGRHQCL